MAGINVHQDEDGTVHWTPANPPMPTTPLAVTAPAFDDADPKTLDAADFQQRLIDQQWRDVVENKVNVEHPLSLNQTTP